MFYYGKPCLSVVYLYVYCILQKNVPPPTENESGFSSTELEAAIAQMVDEMKNELNNNDRQNGRERKMENIGTRKRKIPENRQERIKKGSRQRTKRHVGPHDEDGLQRLISTGKRT